MSDDLIKRSDAIKAVKSSIADGWDRISPVDACQNIRCLPSADIFEITKEALIEAIDNAETVGDVVENIIDRPTVRPQGEVDAIDRDALIDYCLKLIDAERKQGSDLMNYGQERVNQTEVIIDYIEHMPHINTDRPQGEWIRTGRTNIYGGIEVQCSNCGDKVMVQHLEDEWYCRHCGADMGMKGADDETD